MASVYLQGLEHVSAWAREQQEQRLDRAFDAAHHWTDQERHCAFHWAQCCRHLTEQVDNQRFHDRLFPPATEVARAAAEAEETYEAEDADEAEETDEADDAEDADERINDLLLRREHLEERQTLAASTRGAIAAAAPSMRVLSIYNNGRLNLLLHQRNKRTTK